MIPAGRRPINRSLHQATYSDSAHRLRLNRLNNPDLAMTRIKECLRRTNHLKELEICHQTLSKHQASLLSQGLYANHTVNVLNLSRNNLDHEQLGILCAALHHRVAKLKKFQLDQNKIGVLAARQLANYLSTAHTLEHFSLSDNPLGDEGVEILAKRLASLSSLERLDLARCLIGSSGAYILLESFSRLPSQPIVVNLRENQIGKSAQERLLSWAKEKGNRVIVDGNRPID